MSDLTFGSDLALRVKGTLDVRAGTVSFRDQQIPRAAIVEETTAELAIPLIHARVHDDIDTILPETAASDDLGFIEGTFGTDALTLQTSDAKATTVTQYARFPNLIVPSDYSAAGTLKLRVQAGMITTASDGTATVDLQVYAQDGSGAVGSDLCTTAATSINTLISSAVTVADFTITSSGLAPGDILDVRATIAITDSATGTAVIGEITKLAWLYTRM